MLAITHLPPRPAWLLAGMAALAASLPASGQNFALRVTDTNPLGLGSFVPIVPLLPMGPSIAGGLEGGVKGAFTYGIGMLATYDSNFGLSENDEESEYYFNFSPWLSYTSDPEGGAPVTFSANYTPGLTFYADNSDLDDVNQSANMSLVVTGSRTNLSLFGSYSEIAGSDRLADGFVTGALFNTGVQVTRQLAPRTSMFTNLNYAISTYDSGNLEGTALFSGQLGGIWQATERTGVGTSFRYSRGDSDNSGVFETFAWLGEYRYRVTERIWLSASLGPEIGTDDSGENTTNLAVDINARYNINDLWSCYGTLRSATISSPGEVGYLVNDYTLSAGLTRQFTQASMSGGVEVALSDYEASGTTTTNQDNEQNYSLYLGYYRNLFSERLGFNSMLRYSINEGEREWDQVTVSLGLNLFF